MNNWPFLIASLVCFACVGLAMVFVGVLVSMATAFGNKRWPWAVGILCFAPLAVPYVLLHSAEAAWPRGLLLKGLAIALPCLILAGYLFGGSWSDLASLFAD